jgi:hypothetical protein
MLRDTADISTKPPVKLDFNRIFLKQDFVYKIYNNKYPFQLLFEEEENGSFNLLGTHRIRQSVLLSPTKTKCATFDDIVIIPPSESEKIPHIIFIQTTTGNDHDVKLSGVLGMLLLMMLVELNSQVSPRVSFCFVVPNNLFNFYIATKSNFLRNIIPKIGIYVVTVAECLSKQKPIFYSLPSEQVPSSFRPDFFNKENISSEYLTLDIPNSKDLPFTETKDLVDLVNLFEKFDLKPTSKEVFLKRPKFKVISEQTWGNLKFKFTQNRIIPLKIQNEKEIEKENEHVDVKDEEIRDVTNDAGEEEEDKNRKKIRKKNDIFQEEYFSFLNSVKFDYYSQRKHPLTDTISFSNVFSPEFIIRVIYCLMLDINKIENINSSSNKYTFKLFVGMPSTKDSISALLLQVNNLLQVFDDLKRLYTIKFSLD